jgi:protein-S-isoprenylcysteine O-methyltransferase Ste14
MEKIKIIVLKLLYALLFVVVIPLLLILWAKNTVAVIRIPCPQLPVFGYFLFVVGMLIIISGILNLWFYGKGLPMNAFPPKKFVTRGIYVYLRHPIYFGSILLSFAISLIAQSGAGFWLVSPVFTMLVVAYLAGFENEKTMQVFGQPDYNPWLSLPISSQEPASLREVVVSYILVFGPWLVVYEAFILSGIPKDILYTNLPAESKWPIWEFSELFYSFTYLFVLSIPLIIGTKKDLRNFIIDAWYAIILTGILYLLLPFAVQQRAFTAHTFFGNLILMERLMDGPTAAFPSFHVIWAFLAARYFTTRFRNLKAVWFILALLISISCITTGSHSVPDVIAGLCVFALVVYRLQSWNIIRIFCEHLANSWKEWRFGPIRLINHGFYGGAGGAAGIFIIGCFLGEKYAAVAFLMGILAIIGGALWAQFIEGSPRLLRPYGFYGSVTGVLIGGVLIVPVFHLNYFQLIAACAIAAPWIQLLGRLRCLVQGCCHGKPSESSLGIKYNHPMSRVNKIAGWSGKPLYPTQLYSIGCNLFTGLFIFRLVSLGMTATFIMGLYFILNGSGRFVEESYRGEPQTPYFAGLRIYQWIALLTIILGIICTTIPCNIIPVFHFNLASVVWSILIFIFATAAFGLDFPSSNRRFARLTSN